MRVKTRPLNQDDLDRIQAVKEIGNEFVALLKLNVPAGRELSIALTNAEQAVMWATKSITT